MISFLYARPTRKYFNRPKFQNSCMYVYFQISMLNKSMHAVKIVLQFCNLKSLAFGKKSLGKICITFVLAQGRMLFIENEFDKNSSREVCNRYIKC